MGIIKRGYSLQFRSKTPAFQRRGLHLGAGQERSRSALRGDDVAGKRSHRNVPPALSESGFYSRLLPRPQKGWRPPAHPRSQTPESRPHETPFRMITLKQILSQIRTGDWFCSLDLKDAYFHIQIAPHHRRFLRFAFEGVAYQYTGPTLWAVSGPPYFYEVHGRGSFPSETDGNPHSQLPRRLAHSGLVRGGTTFTQNPHPQPLRALGAQGQFRQKRTVSQPTSIVPGYSSGLSSHESGDSARTRSGHSETRGHLQERHRSPTQSVSENAGPYGRSIASVTAGPAPHAPPSNAGWNHGFHTTHGVTDACISGWIRPVWQPWPPGRNPRWMKKGVAMGLVHTRKVVTTDASNTGWGALYEGKPTFGHWSKAERRLPHQLLGMLAVCRAWQFFLPDLIGRHVLIRSGQHVRGVLYKSPGRCLLEAPLYSGRAPSGMGSAQPALAEGSTPAGQTEPRSGYVISEQCPLRGVDAPSAGGSEDLEDLWQGRSRPFRLQRRLSLPNLLFEGQGRVGPRLAQPPPYAFPPIALLPQVVRRVREQGHKVLLVAPLWRNQPWLSELTQLLTAAPWPVPLRRDLLSQANGTIWQPPDPSCGLSTFGRSTGAYWPPRASVKHHFWG